MKCYKLFTLIVAVCFSQISTGQKSDKESDKPVTISGTVRTSNQMPVAGAVFYIDNVKTGYITKNDGSYKIKISPSAVKLKIVSSEHGTDETIIDGRTKINFTLNEPEGQAAGGTGEGEKSVGNAGIDGQGGRPRARKMNTYTDIYQMIRGEVSGVVVSGRSVQIQQGKSFFGSSTPLFVINGVIVNSIDNVNPLEVRSIEVLKGSQAAIYGVRGANGVISINLLNGSEKEK
jgi:TonB-dependent SusC/RagA subfamily outer membrane receptor